MSLILNYPRDIIAVQITTILSNLSNSDIGISYQKYTECFECSASLFSLELAFFSHFNKAPFCHTYMVIPSRYSWKSQYSDLAISDVHPPHPELIKPSSFEVPIQQYFIFAAITAASQFACLYRIRLGFLNQAFPLVC